MARQDASVVAPGAAEPPKAAEARSPARARPERRVRTRHVRLEVLHEATLSLAAPVAPTAAGLQDLLARIAHGTAAALGAVSATVVLAEDPVWVQLAHTALGPDAGEGLVGYHSPVGTLERRPQREGGAKLRVLATGEPVYVPDIRQDTPHGRYAAVYPAMASLGIRSFAAVPLASGERLVGVLSLNFAEPGELRPAEREALSIAAAHAAAALERLRLAYAARRRRIQAEELAAIVTAAASAPDLDSAAASLITGAVTMLGGFHGVVRVYDPQPDGTRLIVAVQRDARGVLQTQAAARDVGLPEPGSFAARLLDGGDALLVPDAWALDPSEYPKVASARRRGRRASVNVPIDLDGRRVGSLHVDHERPNAFGPADLALAHALATQAAGLIERHRAAEELARRAELAALTADVGMAFAAGGPLRPALQRCAEALVERLGAAFARIWTLDNAEEVLVLQASAGAYTHLDGAYSRIRVGHLKVGHIASARQPHLTNAVQDDPRVSDPEWARREGMVAFAGHPLVAEGRVVGVMGMFARRPLPETVLQMLGSVADFVALGIARARSQEERASLAAAVEREGRMLAAIMESMAEGLIVADSAGRIRLLKRPIAGGDDPRRHPLVGKTLDELSVARHDVLVDPRGATEAFARARVAVASRPSFHLELKGSPRRHMRVDLFPISGLDGDTPWLGIMLTDVTASRRLALLEERERIAMDLHDGVIQSLYAVALGLGARARAADARAASQVDAGEGGAHGTIGDGGAARPETERDALRRSTSDILAVIQTLRGYIRDLRPSAGEGAGPWGELRALADDLRATAGLRVTLDLPEERSWPLDADAAGHIVHVAREACSNVVRHAAAAALRVTVHRQGDQLSLTVRDDGRGFDQRRVRRSGLRNMASRAKLLSGRLRVVSRPSAGTTVCLTVPLGGRS